MDAAKNEAIDHRFVELPDGVTEVDEQHVEKLDPNGDVPMSEHDKFTEEISQFLLLTMWPENRLARAAGVSSTALNQFVHGKYLGDNNRIRNKIRAAIEQEYARIQVKRTSADYIETSASRRFFDIANRCRLTNKICVVYGEAGVGKTEAAREYAQQKSTVILIEIDRGYTPLVLFREIMAKLGGTGNYSLHQTFTECVERLRDTGRMVIIDEAEQLTYASLEMVRRLHDKANIGILLCGTSKLINNLRGFRGEYAQLYNRVSMAVKLSPLTENDTKNIVARFLDMKNDCWRIFHKESGGITRRLFMFMDNAIYLSDRNECPIDSAVIETAVKLSKVEAMA